MLERPLDLAAARRSIAVDTLVGYRPTLSAPGPTGLCEARKGMEKNGNGDLGLRKNGNEPVLDL